MIFDKNSTLNKIILSYKKTIMGSRQGIEDVIISMAPQMVTLIVGLVTTILLARGLGPGGMGEYALILSVAGFVVTASDLGINQTAIRFASRAASVDDKQSHHAVLRWAFRIRMFLVIIVVFTIFILAPYICGKIWNMNELTPLLRLSLIISVFSVISSIPIVYFQSLKQFRMNAIVSIGQTSITLIGILVIAWLNKLSIEFIIVTSIIATMIGTIAFMIVVPKDAFISVEEFKKPFTILTNFFREPELPSVKSLEDMNPNKFLFYMTISTIIVAITSNVNIWLIGYYLDKSQIGIYSIAMYFTIPLSLLLTAINTAIWPRASSLKSHTNIRIFLKTTFFLTILVAACGIIYSIIIPLSMPYLFGPAYNNGIILGQALCLGFCIAIVLCPMGVIGYSLGMVRYYWLISVIQLITAITINIILLPKMGIIASAIAYIGYNTIGLILYATLILNKMKRVGGLVNEN